MNKLRYEAKLIDLLEKVLDGDYSTKEITEVCDIWQQQFSPDLHELYERENRERPTPYQLDEFAFQYWVDNELCDLDTIEDYRQDLEEVVKQDYKDTIAQDMGYTIE